MKVARAWLRRRRLSLHAVLAASFGTISIALTSMLVLEFRSTAAASHREFIGEALAETAEQIRHSLEEDVSERLSDVEVAAALFTHFDSARIGDWLNGLKSTSSEFVWIGYVSATGEVIVSTDNLLRGESIREWDVFRDSMQGDRVGDVHERLFTPPLDPNPPLLLDVLHLSAPVYSDDGHLMGIVIAYLNWDWAERVVHAIGKAHSPPSRNVLIVSDQHRVLLGPPNLLDTAWPLGPLRTAIKAGRNYAASASADEPAFIEGYAVTTGASVPTWTIIVRQPAASAFAPVREMEANFLATGVAIAGVFMLLGILLARWIAAPLDAITAAARGIHAGQHRGALPVHTRYQEVRSLSTSLRRLLGKLTAEAERSKAADIAKSQFLANMSHELRTPLNAIIGFSEMLKIQGPKLNDRQLAEYAEHIHSSGTHLLSIVDDLLDLSRADLNALQLSEEEVDLREVAEMSLAVMRGSGAIGNRRIEIRMPPSAPPIRGDRRLIRQMILNLLSNAVKFTQDCGEIHLDYWIDAEGRPIIAVKDNGIGIEPDQLSRLTERFYQVDSGLARRYGGAGLGLAIVRRFAEAHEADLEITSTRGEFTSVSIRFPSERLPVGNSERPRRPHASLR